MESLIYWVLLFPLLGVLLNGLVLSWSPPATRRRTAGVIGTAAAALSFVCALLLFLNLRSLLGGAEWKDIQAFSWIEIGGLSLPFAFRLDPLSATMMLVVSGVGSLIHLYSIGYMAEEERFGRFFTYLNLFLFSMLLLVLANNFALMFVGWEGVGLCSYLLIGFYLEKHSAAQAGKKAFLVNRIGDIGFLLGMCALFGLTGSLVFNTPEGTGALDAAQVGKLKESAIWHSSAVTVICLLFFLGAAGKSAQFPLYLWLPDAMEGPTPVSALIHAATMVTAGVYLVARSAALFGESVIAQSVVAWVGVGTALYAAVIALRQYDIKRVLAYSTVSQLGYMFVGVGVGAYAAGIAHLVTHAFFKALLFLAAGAVMHALDGQLDMRKMGNLKKYLPVTYGTFLVGWLAIIGFPGLSGFWSKDAILEAAYTHAQVWNHQLLFGIGVFTAGLTGFYMTRMFVTVFYGSERIELGEEGHGGAQAGHPRDAHGHGDHEHGQPSRRHPHVHPEQRIMNGPLVTLAVLSVVGGLFVFTLPSYLYPVTAAAQAAHASPAHPEGEQPAGGAAAHGETPAVSEHGGPPKPFAFPDFSKPEVYIPTFAGVLAAALGVLAAWFGFGPDKFARGWSPGVDRALGAVQEAYEGFCHALFVRAGDLLAGFLYTFVDVAVIDNLVDFTGRAVDYLAESLRTLQTGYVRNYALVLLAGVVFVVACFLLILQQWPRDVWLKVGLVVAVAALVVGALSLLAGRRQLQPLPED